MPDDPSSPEDLPPVRPALIADAPAGAEEAAPPPGAEDAAPPPAEGAKPAPRSRTPYYLAGCAVLLVVVLVVVGVVVLVGAGGATVAVLGAGALALAGSLGVLFLVAGSEPDPAIAPRHDDAPAVVVTGEAPHREAGSATAPASTPSSSPDLRSGNSDPDTVAAQDPAAPPPAEPAEDDVARGSESDGLPEEPSGGTSSPPPTSAPPAETRSRPALKVVTGVTTEVHLGKDQPVGLEGDAVVVLVGGGARYSLPGSAPPGRYDIEATFPGEPPLVAGKITVGFGGNAVVVCNTNMGICRAK